MPAKNDLDAASYPSSCATSAPSRSVATTIRTNGYRRIAEVGAYLGATTKAVLSELDAFDHYHIYDFEDRVADILRGLPPEKRSRVRGFGNSRRLADSYCFNLLKQLEAGTRYDYVYIDGAHTWETDVFALLIVDRMLDVGGSIELDDAGWSLRSSPTMNPDAFPMTRVRYTDEQIDFKAVDYMIRFLRRQEGYEETVPNRVFRKLGEAARAG